MMSAEAKCSKLSLLSPASTVYSQRSFVSVGQLVSTVSPTWNVLLINLLQLEGVEFLVQALSYSVHVSDMLPIYLHTTTSPT